MKKLFKENIKTILIIILTVIISSSITAFATIKISATEIGYNNTTVANQLDSLYQTMFSNNYSETEKVVGKWIDNKPLYQKTFVLTNVTSGSYTVPHNISNIDKVVSIGGTNGKGRPIPYVYGSSSAVAQWYAGCDIINNSLRVEAGTNYIAESSTLYITVQYTKTTDSPISN